MEISLKELSPGKRAVVTKILMDAAFTKRLRDFGMVPGTSVCCRYRSPGGQVTALALRGAVIALRTRDLAKIRVHC